MEYLTEDYRGVTYTQGNWFILRTVAGENPDKWKLYREFNAYAIESPSGIHSGSVCLCERMRQCEPGLREV